MARRLLYRWTLDARHPLTTEGLTAGLYDGLGEFFPSLPGIYALSLDESSCVTKGCTESTTMPQSLRQRYLEHAPKIHWRSLLQRDHEPCILLAKGLGA